MKGAIILALALALLLSREEHRPPNAGLPLVRADWPLCVTVDPGPIKPDKPIYRPFVRKPDNA